MSSILYENICISKFLACNILLNKIPTCQLIYMIPHPMEEAPCWLHQTHRIEGRMSPCTGQPGQGIGHTLLQRTENNTGLVLIKQLVFICCKLPRDLKGQRPSNIPNDDTQNYRPSVHYIQWTLKVNKPTNQN